MKYIISLFAIIVICASCINSSTNFSNRGVTYQLSPELIGERASVSGSPTAGDATVNADKLTETKANVSGTAAVTDNSSNNDPKTINSDSNKDKNQ